MYQIYDIIVRKFLIYRIKHDLLIFKTTFVSSKLSKYTKFLRIITLKKFENHVKKMSSAPWPHLPLPPAARWASFQPGRMRRRVSLDQRRQVLQLQALEHVALLSGLPRKQVLQLQWMLGI